MAEPFLERALAGAMPDFRSRWAELRRTYPPDAPPSAEDFLGYLVAHAHQALIEQRAAEITRLFLAVERLLSDADPVLADLLETRLIGALAEECRLSRVPSGLVLPHLGPRGRAAWERASSPG